jgi:hypothetical protein
MKRTIEFSDGRLRISVHAQSYHAYRKLNSLTL